MPFQLGVDGFDIESQARKVEVRHRKIGTAGLAVALAQETGISVGV